MPGSLSVFTLASGHALGDRVCDHLGIARGRLEEREFEDGEFKIRPLESVRGRDAYVLESLHGDRELSVNDKLMRVLVLLAALRDHGAARVTAVAPYLCYARKDRRTKARDPVTSRYVAQLFEAVGLDRIVVLDVHNPSAYQNAFRIPAEHLGAATAFADWFAAFAEKTSIVVVSPDAGGTKRAERFRQALERRLERAVGFAFIDKYRSEGVVRSGAVVGDVEDRLAVILDDLISSGTTLIRAAATCRARGARAVYAAATHAVFSAGARENLAGSALERVAVTDTIPVQAGDRVEVIECAPLLASAIARLHTGGSITALAEP